MGIFNKKKQEEKELPLPEFPRFPSEAKFPAYEEEPFKKSELEIPIKKPVFEMPEEPASIYPTTEKAMFVKIEKYKEAATNIEAIKNQVKETEVILDELEKLKDKEERELANWRETLDQIKQRLLFIDKTLFE